MAIPSVMKPLAARRQWLVTLLLLLLVLFQMLTALIVYGGLFIVSKEAFVSPFHFCLLLPHDGGLSCLPDSGCALPETHNILRMTTILGVYSPLVLVAFALLAMLLSAYGEDRGALWCSVLCQAVSSLFTLVGLAAFVGLYWCHVSLTDMTVWFYVCLCVPAELALTAWLARPVRMEAEEKET